MFSPLYKEAFVICRIKRGDDGVRLDVPFTVINRSVVVSGGNMYSDPLPDALVNRECIAHVVYPAAEDDIVTAFLENVKGKAIKKHAKYKTHWPRTVGQEKTAAARALDPEAPEYDGADKDEPAAFCVFAEDGYEDR